MGIHLLLPRGPIEQVIGLGVAIENVILTHDVWGRSAHFVMVRWVY